LLDDLAESGLTRKRTFIGGRSVDARVNIELTILSERAEDLMALLESAAFSGVYPDK